MAPLNRSGMATAAVYNTTPNGTFSVDSMNTSTSTGQSAVVKDSSLVNNIPVSTINIAQYPDIPCGSLNLDAQYY